VDRQIPFQISAAAARAVQEGGGIRSAPTLLNLLQQATAVADRTELITPVDEPEAAAPPPRQGERPTEDFDAQARRRKALLIGLGVGGAILIVALVVLGSVLSRIFGDVGDGLGGDELGLNSPGSSEVAQDPGSTVKPVSATVFSPEGEADAPNEARLAIDGNPTTVWPIDTYTDPEPFPNFKNGVGLILALPKPTKIGEVTIDVNSTGTAVEIRSAQTPTPTSLEDTTVLKSATTLQPGENTIAVDNAEPTSNLLVWVSKLGTVDGENRSDIAEITLKAAE
jgi:putative peptidoglycan lipid II flippase